MKNKKNEVIQQNYHSRKMLSGIPTAPSNTQGGDPRQRHSGMTSLFNNNGFTLIELLVVVLIIGVLAAVALPQYQKAVKRMRGMEVLVAGDALDKSVTAYYLENGTYSGLETQQLMLFAPKLTHFKYSIGTGSYNDGFKEPYISIGDPQVLFLYMISPEGLIVEFKWEKGKLMYKKCRVQNFTGEADCEDYFHCNSTPREYKEFDYGYGTYWTWSGGTCEL